MPTGDKGNDKKFKRFLEADQHFVGFRAQAREHFLYFCGFHGLLDAHFVVHSLTS
jgi:hypothetical protein